MQKKSCVLHFIFGCEAVQKVSFEFAGVAKLGRAEATRHNQSFGDSTFDVFNQVDRLQVSLGRIRRLGTHEDLIALDTFDVSMITGKSQRRLLALLNRTVFLPKVLSSVVQVQSRDGFILALETFKTQIEMFFLDVFFDGIDFAPEGIRAKVAIIDRGSGIDQKDKRLWYCGRWNRRRNRRLVV